VPNLTFLGLLCLEISFGKSNSLTQLISPSVKKNLVNNAQHIQQNIVTDVENLIYGVNGFFGGFGDSGFGGTSCA